MNKSIIYMLVIASIFGITIGAAENTTNGENISGITKNLYVTADKTEITAGTVTNVVFIVERDCGTEPNEICPAIYPPVKVPVENAIVSINNEDLGKGITNKSGISIIPINPSTARILNVRASKYGYSPALMAINVVYIPPTTTGKFRVGPTVKIRPVNDVINKSSDGLVELYMDNPSLNEITLNVDARVSVPSGVHVYGQGFGDAGAAGTVYGKFDIPPGKARTIYITIKAEKTGEFYAQFSGMYWPGDNKDEYQPISLTHPFKVEEASKSPTKHEDQKNVPGISIGISLMILVIVYLLRKF